MVPTRMVPFALSSLMSWPGKIRMGMDLVLPRGGAARGAGANGDESLGDFVRRRLGKEALARIAEPIVAGIHAGDPEQMSVRATFPMFLEMEQTHRSLILAMLKRRKARQKAAAAGGGPGGGTAGPGGGPRPEGGPRSYFYSFKGGLQELSDAMVASLPPERLHGGAAVRTMAPCGAGCGTSGAGSGAYALQLADGTRVVVDAVVLATPAWASGDLLCTVAPLPAADLSSIEYVSTATASLAFRRDQVAHDLTGFGFVVPRAENRPVMATTWSSSKFPGRAPEGHVLLSSFLGRAGIEAAAQLDDAEMTKVVRAELREVMGISAEPEFAQIFRWPRGMPQYRVGHVDLVNRIEAGVAKVPGIELAGGAYHGIGIGDCLREGAAAADRALEHVRGLPEDAVPPQPSDVPAGDGVVD